MARSDEPRSGPLRCAVYTRKSTEEGLEQSFNSLDAQREACEAYVASQRHEGWQLSPELYDDGGFSGGNMERPGLKQLLADVKAGKIHVVVVYKVDRLTRSLADFAKIVDILDAAKASFVSVTQSFNTTSSMGRLTLNVLLSFAQFEREVTGERIRDKVAQSKARGMWMGGNIPLGYNVEDRKLQIVEDEADKVRLIFRRYLALGSVRALADELDDAGIRSQRRVSRSGRTLGGGRLAAGALYHILKARVYIGEVTHDGKSYPGQHQGIIDAETFDQVQQLLARNAEARQAGEHAAQPSLLAYLVWDGLGRRMSPNHTRRRGRVHQYYASRQTTREERAAAAWRVSAADLEEVVVGALVHRLRHREAMRDVLLEMSDVQAIQETFDRAAMLADDIISASALEKRQLIANLIRRVTVRKEKVEILICLDGLCPDGIELTDGRETEELLTVAARITRAGSRSVLAIAPSQVMANQRQDLPLIKLVTKAYAARLRVETEPVDPKELARTTGQDKDYFARLVRLGYLAPDIITAILEGRQPPTLTRQHLARVSKLPLDWAEQRQLLGFASA